jgi:hypothetical protein
MCSIELAKEPQKLTSTPFPLSGTHFHSFAHRDARARKLPFGPTTESKGVTGTLAVLDSPKHRKVKMTFDFLLFRAMTCSREHFDSLSKYLGFPAANPISL